MNNKPRRTDFASIRAEYASIWDEGIKIISEIVVDLDRMRITEFSTRWLGDRPATNEDLSRLEVLQEEYVYIPETDTYYTATAEYKAPQTEDRYGNGIIVY